MPSPRTTLHLTLVTLALVVSTSAAATSPRSGPVAIRGLDAVPTSNSRSQITLTRGRSWQDFLARNGRWSVIWNEATQTPHRAFGRGIALAGFRPEASAVDHSVRDFMAGHPEFFGASPQLETIAAHRAGNVWYVRYHQTLGGIPLLFSNWEFRVSLDGKLFAFGADAHHPGVELLSQPRIPGIVAREAAKGGLSFDPATDRVTGGTDLSVLPVRQGSDFTYRLVYDVRVHTTSPRGYWKTLVDATTAEVVWRSNQLLETGREPVQRGAVTGRAPGGREPVIESLTPMQPLAAITGKVTGRVHPLLPTDGLTARNYLNLFVRADNSATTTTNSVGDYSFTCSAATLITASLSGPYFHVDRTECINCNALFSLSVACPSTRPILWDTPNSTDGERDAFYHSNVAHAYVKSIDPAYVASDRDLALRVDDVNNECVAFWDEGTIVFGDFGATCPYNMASLPDIVYRSYAMRVNEDLYFAQGSTFGITNEAINRGSADVMAAFMTDDPIIGDGIEGVGTFFRDISIDKRWPDDRSAEPNETGLILAGTFWDLRQSLGLGIAQTLVHFAKYGLPGVSATPIDDGQAMTDFFIETLVADDVDADISNGTPHFTQILAAFNAHGIGTGNLLTIAHEPLVDQPGNGPFPISAVIQYTGPVGILNAGSPTLHYNVNGQSYFDVPMTPTGNPDEYGAEIPAQAAAIVRYYVSAAESFGGTQTSPGGAPARSENLFVAGPSSTVLSYDMSTNPGWTAGAVGDNATGGVWVRAEPVGTVAQPDLDHTELGDSLCFVTANGPPGDPNPGTDDVDDGKTTLLTGVFNATPVGTGLPIISYYRWYSNNAGDAPSEDFWQVDISNNGGTSWVPVENTTSTDQYWRRQAFFIKDYVTPTSNMRMRFVASDLLSVSLVEAAVDDWSMLTFPTGVGVEPIRVTTPLALEPAAPNPFSDGTHLRYSLPQSGPVEITVFDIHGRQVRNLVGGTQESGTHTVNWDGRDQGGRRVPSGPYFVRLSHGSQTSRQAVVRIQ